MFKVGDRIEIKWISSNIVSALVDVYVLNGNNKGHTESVRMENGKGSLLYTLDSKILPGSDYKVKVSTDPRSALYATDSSNNTFTINSASVVSNTNPNTNSGSSCKDTMFTNLLRVGSKGIQVEYLQILLNDKGYLGENQVDGSFGFKTKKALMNLQSAYGLKADGIAGMKTRSLLNDLWNKQYLLDQSNG